MTLAWKTGLPSGQKMVLLALCDNANDQGECFPSVTMLAEKCSMGARTVQHHITDLEASSILVREMRQGRSTVYHINPSKLTPAESAPRKIRTPQISHHTPADSAPPPPQNLRPTPADLAPITIKEPSIESSINHQKPAPKKARPVSGVDELVALGVEKQVATDWIAIRSKKRLPLTKTALDETVAQASKAGLSLDQAIRTCCRRGWAGFEASWLAGKSSGGTQTPNEKFMVSHLDHSSSNAAMAASMKRHGIVVPADDDDVPF